MIKLRVIAISVNAVANARAHVHRLSNGKR